MCTICLFIKKCFIQIYKIFICKFLCKLGITVRIYLVSCGLSQITSIYFCLLNYKKNTVKHYLIDLERAANWRAPRAAKVLGTPLLVSCYNVLVYNIHVLAICLLVPVSCILLGNHPQKRAELLAGCQRCDLLRQFRRIIQAAVQQPCGNLISYFISIRQLLFLTAEK